MYPYKEIVGVLFVELHERAEDWERKRLGLPAENDRGGLRLAAAETDFSLSRRMTAVVQELAWQLRALHRSPIFG